jgi:hypothetical protein
MRCSERLCNNNAFLIIENETILFDFYNTVVQIFSLTTFMNEVMIFLIWTR